MAAKTPLHLAAQSTSVNAVALLIELGANIEAEDEDENRPIHDAIKHNRYEIAEYLIEAGADISGKCDNPPLSYAVRNIVYDSPDPYDMIYLLVSEDPYCVNRLNVNKIHPIHQIGLGYWNYLDVLIRIGMDICIPDANHKTIIHRMIEVGNRSLIPKLLIYVPDINSFHLPLLHHAIEHWSEDIDPWMSYPLPKSFKYEGSIISMLLERGACLNTPNPLDDNKLPYQAAEDECLVSLYHHLRPINTD